jgi:hypothetical protein
MGPPDAPIPPKSSVPPQLCPLLSIVSQLACNRLRTRKKLFKETLNLTFWLVRPQNVTLEHHNMLLVESESMLLSHSALACRDPGLLKLKQPNTVKLYTTAPEETFTHVPPQDLNPLQHNTLNKCYSPRAPESILRCPCSPPPQDSNRLQEPIRASVHRGGQLLPCAESPFCGAR